MARSRWSELPGDLLKIIEGNLGLYDEQIRFRCVCTHFGKSVGNDLPDLRQPQPPWLLLPYKTGSMCGLYHPLEKKVFDIDLPEAGDKFFKGTGHGWVVTAQPNGSIDVLNPLTRDRVPLPPRHKFPDVLKYDPNEIGKEYLFEYDGYLPPGETHPPVSMSSTTVRNSRIVKIVISSSPLSDDFIAVAIYACVRLAYCRAGDSEWRCLVESEDTEPLRYKDVTFLGGKLYAVSVEGEMMVCDDIRSCPRLRECDHSIPPFEHFADDHLINRPDGLMIVRRNEEYRKIGCGKDTTYTCSTDGFEIYKLVNAYSRPGYSRWARMDSLGDDEVLFMGLGTQMGFSGASESNGNRIYFASDKLLLNCEDVEDCFDNGVFDFEDGSIKPLGYECSPRVIWPSPIWVTPRPY